MLDITSIASWFRRTFGRKDVIALFLIVCAYFFTRIINLDKFPIFTDEGIYIHWAKVAWKDAAWRFISLTDGKQPLHTWGMIPFLKIFSPNMLLGGRMFSVLTGFAALAGLYSITLYLFNKKVAFLAACAYVLTPMFMFYDRMALIDSAVNAGAVWLLFLSIVLARTLRLDIALIYGLSAGVALLAKSSSTMFVGLSALAPIAMLSDWRKRLPSRAITYYILFGIAGTIALVLYNIQRLSPYLHFVAQKNATFVMTLPEFIKTPFLVVRDNSWRIPYYIASEMSYVSFALGLAGLWLLFRKDRNLGAYLLLWIIGPFIAIAFFAKVVFPRYLIFFASFLTIGAAYLTASRKKFVSKIIIIFFLLSTAYFNYTILFRGESIPFPDVDRGQYIESNNAGYGIREIIDYSRKKSAEKPVILVAEGNFGVVGDMLDASVAPGERITVRGYWPLNESDLFANQKELQKNHVFIVYSHKRDGDFLPHWPIKLIKKYDKPGGKSSFHFFQLVERL